MDVTISTAEKLDDDAKNFTDEQWHLYDEATYPAPFSREPFAIAARDQEGAPIGTATGWLSMGVGYLSELIVSPDHRRSGVGGRLLEEFERHAAASSHHRLALRTEINGDGHGLYEAKGWRVEAEIDNWLGGKTFVQMRKDLPEVAPTD